MKTTMMKKLNIAIAAIIMMAAIVATPAAAYADSSVQAFSSSKDAGAYYSSQMLDHASEISFTYVTDSANASALVSEIRDEALSNDYIHYSIYNGSTLSYTYTQSNGKYYYTMRYAVSYKTTAAQEKAFSNKLNSTMKSLNLSGKTDYQKVKTIYSYITKNVSYDRVHSSTYYKKYSAYAALVNKTAVCQGYATLFYEMCEKAGVDSKVITGTSNNENHAWNIVKLNGKWYNIDATWDAGHSTYSYFLKSNSNFKDHTRSSQYSNASFNSEYKMATSNY